MDVTRVSSLGKLKCHVIMDTYSLLIFTVPLSAEAVKDVITILLRAFAILGPVEY